MEYYKLISLIMHAYEVFMNILGNRISVTIHIVSLRENEIPR